MTFQICKIFHTRIVDLGQILLVKPETHLISGLLNLWSIANRNRQNCPVSFILRLPPCLRGVRNHIKKIRYASRVDCFLVLPLEGSPAPLGGVEGLSFATKKVTMISRIPLLLILYVDSAPRLISVVTYNYSACTQRFFGFW